MAEAVVRTRAVISAGSYSFGPVQLTIPVSQVVVTFDRFSGAPWPSGTVISFMLEWSPNGSSGWVELCATRNAAVSQNLLPVEASFRKGGTPLPSGSFVRAQVILAQAVDCQIRIIWQ